jgi:hypothetical protein
MKNHYSLFQTDDRNGRPCLINLDLITHITLENSSNYAYCVYFTNCECIELCPVDGDRLMAAWNIFLGVKFSQHHVIAAVENKGATPTSVNSGLRIEEFLLNAVTCSQMRWEEEEV